MYRLYVVLLLSATGCSNAESDQRLANEINSLKSELADAKKQVAELKASQAKTNEGLAWIKDRSSAVEWAKQQLAKSIAQQKQNAQQPAEPPAATPQDKALEQAMRIVGALDEAEQERFDVMLNRFARGEIGDDDENQFHYLTHGKCPSILANVRLAHFQNAQPALAQQLMNQFGKAAAVRVATASPQQLFGCMRGVALLRNNENEGLWAVRDLEDVIGPSAELEKYFAQRSKSNPQLVNRVAALLSERP